MDYEPETVKAPPIPNPGNRQASEVNMKPVESRKQVVDIPSNNLSYLEWLLGGEIINWKLMIFWCWFIGFVFFVSIWVVYFKIANEREEFKKRQTIWLLIYGTSKRKNVA